MAEPQRCILILRLRPAVIKWIRGFKAERDDPTPLGTGAIGPEHPFPAPFLARGSWGRPLVSAPIPAIGGDRLGAYHFPVTILDGDAEDYLQALEATYPNFFQFFKQRLAPPETPRQFDVRVAQAVGWIERPRDPKVYPQGG